MMNEIQQATPILEKIFCMQNFLLEHTDWEGQLPEVTHHFGPKVYIREILMEADRHKYVIGATHKTKHFNIVMSGRASVLMDYDKGEWAEVKAGAIFTSEAGVKKVLIIHEDMRWLTVHPLEEDATEADVERLEEMLSDEPPTRIHREALTKKELRNLANERDRQRGLT